MHPGKIRACAKTMTPRERVSGWSPKSKYWGWGLRSAWSSIEQSSRKRWQAQTQPTSTLVVLLPHPDQHHLFLPCFVSVTPLSSHLMWSRADNTPFIFYGVSGFQSTVTNDDGPCSSTESPFIYSFSRQLRSDFLGPSSEKLKVVIPDSQKSWIGKAYIIKDTISLSYFDPKHSTRSPTPITEPGREEWILLSGTPASCSNIGLFNLFPEKIDLVISGPNYGRNTSSAFSLSSGTIGASMDAALSNHRTIALSYGVFERPISQELLDAANKIAVKVIKHLWHVGFQPPRNEEERVDLYSVNIPVLWAPPFFHLISLLGLCLSLPSRRFVTLIGAKKLRPHLWFSPSLFQPF